jgi:hypothetical protein
MEKYSKVNMVFGKTIANYKDMPHGGNSAEISRLDWLISHYINGIFAAPSPWLLHNNSYCCHIECVCC